ncbi:hypothetical protein I6A84_04500 [Frankia sp. CNm7]|uniref:Uncharacterized protein n=1 Tax=Frankia nepalensis TaxID=1836974 RepID=A0A937RC22_9ACTN|nr:helix-turn-helix transcriptional regulator [Frankia nepalensis]MBL7498735.1 hypothetical protein [Frankia nepalensis]MBL7508400.1 hypothetical protein [Frankia nepalensis]MBL7517400.1 hypothetical protein [Frankia nepalensis]MBL7626230.1 hypothetical protein [Frankia nepalensis]
MTPTTATSATSTATTSPAADVHGPPTTEPPPAGGTAEDWVAVAAALNTRLTERRLTQQRLADLSRISVATIRVLQRGTSPRRVRDTTLAAVSRALAWPDGHLLSILLRSGVPNTDTDPATGTSPLASVTASLRPHHHPDRRPEARSPTEPDSGQHPLARIATDLDTASAAIDDARAHLTHTDQVHSAERDLALAWLETATARLEQAQAILSQAAPMPTSACVDASAGLDRQLS